MWENLQGWERVGVIILLLGSIVDIYQFTWIIKKAWSSYRESLYKKIQDEFLLEQIKKINAGKDQKKDET